MGFFNNSFGFTPGIQGVANGLLGQENPGFVGPGKSGRYERQSLNNLFTGKGPNPYIEAGNAAIGENIASDKRANETDLASKFGSSLFPPDYVQSKANSANQSLDKEGTQQMADFRANAFQNLFNMNNTNNQNRNAFNQQNAQNDIQRYGTAGNLLNGGYQQRGSSIFSQIGAALPKSVPF